MRESGIITEIEEHTMMVEFERSSMCEKCGACERAHNAMRMEVERIGNASLGDRVEVDLPERTVVRAALVAYGIPLALLLAGLGRLRAAGPAGPAREPGPLRPRAGPAPGRGRVPRAPPDGAPAAQLRPLCAQGRSDREALPAVRRLQGKQSRKAGCKPWQ